MITTTDAWLSILHLSLLFCRCLLECCHFWKGLWIVIQWKELPPLNFLIILSFVAQQTLHLLLTWWKVSDIVFASQEELNRKYKDFSPSKANFSSECWSLWFFHNVTCPPSSHGNKSYRLWFFTVVPSYDGYCWMSKMWSSIKYRFVKSGIDWSTFLF